MQALKSDDEHALQVAELAEIIRGFADLCQICFALLGHRGNLFLIHDPIGAGCLAPPFSLPSNGELIVEHTLHGELRVNAAIRLAGETRYYLVAGLPSTAVTGREQDVRRQVQQLRSIIQLFLRKDQELEGLARETLLRYEELNLLYEMGESIISNDSLDEIVSNMLERAIEVTEAQGGAIVLLSLEGGEKSLSVQVALGWRADQAPKGKTFGAGDGALAQVIGQGRPQDLERVLDDQLYGSPNEPVELQSVICAPLATTARLVGGLILVNKRTGGYFTAGDEKLSLAIAIQAAIAIENSRLQQRMREEERISASLQRYVSPNVVSAVMERGGLQELIGDRRKATILFVDIRDFTVIVEKTPPNIMIGLLNEYFRETTEIIFQHQGAIDEFAGDQLLAFFGIPLATPKGPENAVRAALAIMAKMEELREDWTQRGLPTFRVGAGLNTGLVAVGNIGSEKRMELTVIGPPVVIASRVEELNKEFGTQILVTQDTLEEVKELVLYRELGPQQLKGVSNAIQLYEITGLRNGNTLT